MNKINKYSSLTILVVFGIVAIVWMISCEKPEREAKVETGEVTDIMATSAKVSGEIIDVGEGITEHGHCWEFASKPTISDLITTFGPIDVTGNFISQLQNLEAGKLYYVRAYVISMGEIKYGNEVTFTTLKPPTATTDAATNISVTTATLNGTVNANGQSTTVTFEYGITTSYGSIITASQSPFTGSTNTSVSTDIAGLTANTTYHFRVKAVNTAGTNFGLDQTFTTSILPPPTATTNPATNISVTTAILNGTINANGQSTTVTFEYGITTSYGSTITASQSPVTGSTNTSVSAGIAGLTSNTTYHFRVKAESIAGSNFGLDQTFKTITLQPPTATTIPATYLTGSSATLNGTVNANGQSTTVTFEYGGTTSYGSTITAYQSPVTGSTNTSVSAVITGLTPNTTYHFRVEAESTAGQTNGVDQSFITTTTTYVTDIEGNVYSTVVIGTQVWMQENLKTTKYNDGTAIPLVTDNTTWSNMITPGYCWYNNNAPNYKATYGALYNWYAVNTNKLCPIGWHVPSDAEWTTLLNFLGGESVAGGKMKEVGITHWISPNTGATNESGFTALPGGYRYINGYFYGIGDNASFWSSTKNNSYNALYHFITYNYIRLSQYSDDQRHGFSVRCLRNE